MPMHTAVFLLRAITGALIVACALAACGGGSEGAGAPAATGGTGAAAQKADTSSASDTPEVHYAP